jgi:hypothetical protein
LSHAGKIEKLSASTSHQRNKRSLEVDYATQRLQHKNAKLQSKSLLDVTLCSLILMEVPDMASFSVPESTDLFREMERMMYNSLFTLIKDTSVLRDYAAASLVIVQVRTCSQQRYQF